MSHPARSANLSSLMSRNLRLRKLVITDARPSFQTVRCRIGCQPLGMKGNLPMEAVIEGTITIDTIKALAMLRIIVDPPVVGRWPQIDSQIMLNRQKAASLSPKTLVMLIISYGIIITTKLRLPIAVSSPFLSAKMIVRRARLTQRSKH